MTSVSSAQHDLADVYFDELIQEIGQKWPSSNLGQHFRSILNHRTKPSSQTSGEDDGV
jgi:hypothetical protein